MGIPNNDGVSNTILDAEIAGFEARTTPLSAARPTGSRIIAVEFNTGASIVPTPPPLADLDANGIADKHIALRGLNDTGVTTFEAALQQAETFFAGTAAGWGGTLFFLSDGQHNTPTTRPGRLCRRGAALAGIDIRASASARMPARRSSTRR
ncbi:MAG: hypothetical protein R3D65_00345 [Zhengella sp.]|uniref:hypothetical protein n=1 Tax=Zhengella sp. TaxID=2282762 RepID=UPI0035298BD4